VREQKKAVRERLLEYEGVMIQPLAYFFHAQVKDSVMECHPERVKIVKAQRKEGN
jgi:hypothetical protein